MDQMEKQIYSILQKISSEVRLSENQEVTGGAYFEDPLKISKQEFVDQLLLALRMYFNAVIGVYQNDTIVIWFSNESQFKIKITG